MFSTLDVFTTWDNGDRVEVFLYFTRAKGDCERGRGKEVVLFFDPFLERLWKLKTWKSVSLYNSCFLLWGSLCLSQRYTYSRLNTSDLSQKAFIIYLTRSPEVGSVSVDSVVPQCLLLPTLLPSFTDGNLMTAIAPSITVSSGSIKSRKQGRKHYTFSGRNHVPRGWE